MIEGVGFPDRGFSLDEGTVAGLPEEKHRWGRPINELSSSTAAMWGYRAVPPIPLLPRGEPLCL